MIQSQKLRYILKNINKFLINSKSIKYNYSQSQQNNEQQSKIQQDEQEQYKDQLHQLRYIMNENMILNEQKLSEKEYNDKIDESFKVYPIILQLQQNEEYNISQSYYNILDYLVNIKTFKTNYNSKEHIDNELLNWINNRTLKNKSENYLRIERISQAKSINERQFHLQHRGHLQIFGVNEDRNKNGYIHQYQYNKSSAELKFTRRITSQEKLANLDIKDIMPEELQGKQRKVKKQIEDIMSNNEKDEQQQNNGIRGTFINLAKKFGYEINNNIDGSEYVNKLSQFKKSTFNNMRSNEEYLLIEDFAMRTTESICVKTLSGNIVWQDSCDSNGLYNHFIRTQSLCHLSEPHSVKNNRKRIIIDIDGKLVGNPPCLVKQFYNNLQ